MKYHFPAFRRLAGLFAISLSALAVPLHAQDAKPAKCQLATETLKLAYTGETMLPTVPASINGNPTTAVIDLSSAVTYLNKEAVERLGVPTFNTFASIDGVGGTSKEYRARVNEISVGPSKGKGNFVVYDLGRSDHGVNVGTDHMMRFDLELSPKEKVLRFLVPTNCRDADLAYWPGDVVSLPFTIYNNDNKRPEFMIKVDGKEMTAILATTVESSVMDVVAASRLPGKSAATFSGQGSSRASGGNGTLLPVWIGEFKDIEIGGERITNAKMNVMSLEGINPDVILGMDFIRAHRILISMSQRRIYFSYLGGPAFHTGSDINVPWVKSEAEAGNPDAMFRLGLHLDYAGEKHAAEAEAWMRKAAAAGHAGALERLATDDFATGRLVDATKGFRDAFGRRPPRVPFYISLLYSAAARSSGRVPAQQEMRALRRPEAGATWGNHVLDFHMDKISREQLFKHAAADQKKSASRLCEANFQAGQYELIGGKTDSARSFFKAAKDGCSKTETEQWLAGAELERMDAAAK